MNSKIHKVTDSSVKADSSLKGWVVGHFLHQKLESWCSAEPSVLMHELSFSQMATKKFIALGSEDSKGRDIPGGWIIEFNIVRASTLATDGLFDGVFILSGLIKDSVELVGGKSQNAYFLSINSRNFKDEDTFIDVSDLWRTLTTLGCRQYGK